MKKISLFEKLGTIIVLTITAVMVLNGIFIYLERSEKFKKHIQQDIELSLQTLKKSTKPFIESYSINEYEHLLEIEIKQKKFLAITISDNNMMELLSLPKYTSGWIFDGVQYQVFKDNNESHQKLLTKSFLAKSEQVKDNNGKTIAQITIYTSNELIKSELNNIVISTVINTFIILLLLILMLFFTIKKHLISPLDKVVSSMDHKDQDGLPMEKVPQTGTKEIDIFLDTINTMINDLRKQKEEFETIFNTTKDGLAVMDENTNFLRVNDAYCTITGLSKEALLQTSCIALTIKEDQQRAMRIFEELLQNGHIDDFEKTCIINDNKIVVAMSISMMPDGKHILSSIKDITHKKIYEEQAKLASMGEMLGNIAHQWRQPLSVISTIASGIKLRKDFDTLGDYDFAPDMEEIVEQTKYLSKTIDDFRNFIKNSNQQEHIFVSKALEKTINILHSALKNNNITLVQNINADMEIYGYENELIQSFINIINNARDALKENVLGDEDKIILIETSMNENHLFLEFKDSGGGIDEAILSRIFEPYFTTKHQSFGTGIGLSMTYNMITKRHNASIVATNCSFEHNEKKYRGACFKIEFL